MTDHSDLRTHAVEAVANYLHHRLFDEVCPVNALPFIRGQADELLACADRAVDATKSEGKRMGLL